MCLLSLIDQEPIYGYEIANRLASQGLELVSEGSIYPMLSRLSKRGFIEGYFVESPEGPPRKYYRILPDGKSRLKIWTSEWNRISTGVQSVLERSTI